QSTLRSDHTILPKPRAKGENYSWIKSKGTSWEPLITIKQMIAHGVRVGFPDSGKGFNAIVWDKKLDLFSDYVKSLEDAKNQQDEWANSDNPELRAKYNPALRTMLKLLLNALSGKVIQKHHNSQCKVISGVDTLEKALLTEEIQQSIGRCE